MSIPFDLQPPSMMPKATRKQLFEAALSGDITPTDMPALAMLSILQGCAKDGRIVDLGHLHQDTIREMELAGRDLIDQGEAKMPFGDDPWIVTHRYDNRDNPADKNYAAFSVIMPIGGRYGVCELVLHRICGEYMWISSGVVVAFGGGLAGLRPFNQAIHARLQAFGHADAVIESSRATAETAIAIATTGSMAHVAERRKGGRITRPAFLKATQAEVAR